jgi:catechol 2,3-dioxygenase-like lactoylglutathione lyase family enzyme
MIRFHHAHLMASDLDATIAFFSRWFGATVAGDVTFAGARNVFLRFGDGRLHLYDQPPRATERNAIHHLGIQTDDLDGLVARMKAGGIEFRKPITEDPMGGRYMMVEAPDHILLELFEVDPDRVPEDLRSYFS